MNYNIINKKALCLFFNASKCQSLSNLTNEIPSGFERISFGGCDVSFDIHPKGEYKINDQRGAHRKKRNINKPCAYPGSSDSQPVADSRTNSEHLPLNEFLHPVHTAI
jgi:hypothetical protein